MFYHKKNKSKQKAAVNKSTKGKKKVEGKGKEDDKGKEEDKEEEGEEEGIDEANEEDNVTAGATTYSFQQQGELSKLYGLVAEAHGLPVLLQQLRAAATKVGLVLAGESRVR